MGEFDPTKVGLKCGLEIHQQLGSPGDRKLFSPARADIVEGEPDLVVRRRLRASAGETGSVDIAAMEEQEKQKEYVYQAFDEVTSLVEIDEEPPHPVNKDALKTAVMVSKAMGSTIFPRVQFMRKTIVDGSAVSGFQRTGLIAVGGSIPELKQEVGIQTIGLEEDSAKIVEKTPGKDTYNLSRLGIPLVEIATAPDIKTPEQAREVAAQIGMILRSTKRVKRGLGTIRQDLNVSIKGGVRNEIKGAQDLKMVPAIIRNEAQRQHNLIRIKKELPDFKTENPIDVSKTFKDAKGFVKSALKKGKAIGFRITNFKGFLGRELCPEYRLGTELADLIKPRGFGGIIHSDEDMKKYGGDPRKILGCKEEDAFIVLLGDEDACKHVIETILVPRLKKLKEGIPQEVRRANPNGTTSYLRPVPGAARMYPETDIPIVEVPTDVKAPELLTKQVGSFAKKYKLSKDHAQSIVQTGVNFEKFVRNHPKLEVAFMANAIVSYGKDIQSRYKKDIDHISYLDELFSAVEEKKIPKDAVFELLVDAAHGKKINYSKYQQMPDEELRKIIQKVVKANPDVRPNALMGDIMKETRGKADGKRVMRILQEAI